MRAQALVALVMVHVATTIAAFPVTAYELRTHGRLTEAAFMHSPGVATYFVDVAMDPDRRLDRASATPLDRLADFDNTATPRDWMIEGSIREDDYRQRPALELLGCDPPRNPPSSIDRPLQHFLDPQRGGLGLTVGGVGFISAADWALGRLGRGPEPTGNTFTLPDARLYQLRSLTAAQPETRDRNAALMFRALGHAVHLVQDMAQPQHTRNDRHAGCLGDVGGEHSWYEDYVESRALGRAFRRRGEPAPALSLTSRPVPAVGRFADLFSSPSGTGLADFSARGFFSAATNLSLTGDCGGLPEPPCRRDAYGEREAAFSFLAADGSPVSGVVRLLTHTLVDPVTGETIPDVPISSRSLWDQHLERRGFLPAFTLNTLNYDAMVDVLLPRAVGHSAAFLDHFFRGRLDVELLEEPADPSLLRLESVNLADERMAAGALSIYSERADGTRRRLGAPADVADVAARSSLPPLVAPGDDAATRMIAVYQGGLGEEAADPASGNPGAVVARVVPVPRVEEVFSDGVRWQLRTAAGVFPLPILAAEIEDLRWGDVDNTLVGRTRLGQGAPSRLRAYRINRPAGSTLVPQRKPDDSGVRLVDVAVTAEAVFPLGLAVGTSVEFTARVGLVQDLVTFDDEEELVWQEGEEVYRARRRFPTNPGPAVVDRVLAAEFPASSRFAVTLDAGRLDAPAARPYYWTLREIGLDAAGRMLAVVEVVLTSPETDRRTVRLLARNHFSGLLEPAVDAVLQVAFPVTTLLFATVDVGAGRVVASTASPTFAPVVEAVEHHVLFQKRVTGPALGGPMAGRDITVWELHPALFTLGTLPPGFPPAAVEETATVEGESGPTAFALSGWYRPELASLVETPVTIARWPAPPLTLIYGFQLADDGTFLGYTGLRSAPTISSLHGYVTSLRQARRLRPGPGAVQLLVFGRPVGIVLDEGEEGVVVDWKPEAGSATLALPFELPPAAEHRVASASSRRALVVSRSDVTGPASRLVDLDTSTAVGFGGDDLSERFVVLDPAFLYNADDLRFYRPRSPLRRGALPPRLAPVPGNPVGDYHAIGEETPVSAR